MIRLLLLALLAGQTGTHDAVQHFQAGLEARKQHEIDVEIAEFRKATEIDPSLADAFVNLGTAYMEKHDYGAAIAPLKRALELSPDLPVAHQLLGYALLTQGYAAEAIPHLEKVGAKEALGIAQIETGQLAEAVNNFGAALAERPEDPDLLYYLGHSSGLLSKNAIDTLLATHPDSARAHQALAENYFVLRQMPQAETEYKEALRIRPELPGLHLELGQVYANSAQWTKAEEEFRAETKLQPGNAEAAYRLGAALLQQGKAHEALAELKRSIELKPDMPETLYSLGKAASLDGEPGTAEKAWLRVTALEKNTSLAAQTHFALATLYRKQGKTAEAQHEMQEFQKLQSTIGPPRSE
ncbi:MAG TPA: tetratricopeptide repeat protein [Candidatus Acidoferrum sp.]|nr:tetratricopeptide repeat protein [Candidatus Acidoferrum sp.]